MEIHYHMPMIHLKKDKEIVMEVVKQNADSLDYADDSLKRDIDIIMEAIKTNKRFSLLVMDLTRDVLL